ncbi:hypothetical protein N7497_001046 [Penicillium chrysogenum]|nr:hypothetical protein N7497_001046 [Penicillium chrysogenum]
MEPPNLDRLASKFDHTVPNFAKNMEFFRLDETIDVVTPETPLVPHHRQALGIMIVNLVTFPSMT